MAFKPIALLALIVTLSIISHSTFGAVQSLIANRIDNPSENRYSFCISSSHLPSTASFTAVLHFSFVDVDGQPIEFSSSDSFVVGFPNAEFQLIRSHVSSVNVLVHQGEAAYFNWDAEAYLNTAHTTGIVVSNYRLVGVALIVESEEIVPVEANSKFTCDSPMDFIEDIIAQQQQAQQEIEQLPQQEIEQLPQLVDPQEEQPIQVIITNQEASSTPTVISWIYLISILIVSAMSIACVARICCARRRYVEPADEELMMAEIDESQYQLVELQQDQSVVPQPIQQEQQPQQVIVHPQPVMTASGVQYILVPQEFLIAQQQQQQQQQFQQLQQLQQPMNAGMFVYPGQLQQH